MSRLRTTTGWTPLNWAADEGHVDVVRLLLEKGADVAVANSNGWTPLNLAASNGYIDVVRLLLESVRILSCMTVNVARRRYAGLPRGAMRLW